MKQLRVQNLVLLAVVLLAAGLRIDAAGDEFWLDEAWSVIDVRGHSFASIFTTYVDNNHLLNSIWIWLVGQPWNWFVYRIPSVLAGIGTVIFAWRIARRRSPAAGLIAAIVFAFSFPLIVYSSEARGYSEAIFFALVCWDLLTTRKWPWLYCICIALGLLSHLTFASFVIAAAIYFLYMPESPRPCRGSHGNTVGFCVGRVITFVAIPFLLLAVIYWFFARHLKIAGGPAMHLADVLKETGDVFAGTWIFALALLVIAIARLIWRKDRRLVFYLVLIGCAFGLLLTSSRPEVVYVRYFLIPATFLLLQICEELMSFGNRILKAIASLAIFALAIVNAQNSIKFIEIGRGSSLTALTYVASHSRGSSTTIGALWLGEGGDHESRIRRLIEFYRPYLPAGRQLVLIKADDSPEWLLVTSRSKEMPTTLRDRYKYETAFPHFGPSGWTWVLYRRQ